MVVWDWQRGKALGQPTKTGGNAVYHINFDSANDNVFMTVASKTAGFFTMAPGGKVTRKNAIFGRKFKSQTQFRTAAHRGGFLTGSCSGELYTWTGNSASKTTPAHQGPVYALFTNDKHVVTGGKDGRVILWDLSLKQLEEFVVGQSVKSVTRGALECACYMDCRYSFMGMISLWGHMRAR